MIPSKKSLLIVSKQMQRKEQRENPKILALEKEMTKKTMTKRIEMTMKNLYHPNQRQTKKQLQVMANPRILVREILMGLAYQM